MAESDARRRLYSAKNLAGAASTLKLDPFEPCEGYLPVKFALDQAGEAIRVVPTPAGARRRTTTPGAPTDRMNRTGGGRVVMAPSSMPAAEAGAGEPRVQAAGRLGLIVLGACFAAAGLLFLADGLGADARSERLAVFREFLWRAEAAPPLPLPAALQTQPPEVLRASWQPGGGGRVTEFQLGLLEVPFTADVLGDAQDPDDEAGLLPSVNSAEGAWRSKLYRAVVPVGDLWLAGLDPADHRLATSGGPGVLRILLPDGSVFLEHTFEPLRSLPVCRQGSDRSSCGGLSVAARLCYALPAGDGPWNGAVTFDCEHSHRSPVYVPLQRHRQHHRGDVEIILRSRMDVYVHASEVTRGCSNCQGYPYGSEDQVGTDALACGSLSKPAEHRMPSHILDFLLGKYPCFGHPVRRLRAAGLSLLALACFSFALVVAISRLAKRPEGNYGKLLPVLVFGGAVLIGSALQTAGMIIN